MLLSRMVLLWRPNHRDSTLGVRLRERRCFDTSDCHVRRKEDGCMGEGGGGGGG